MLIFDNLSLIFIGLILLGVIPNLFYMFGYLPHIKRKSHFLIHYFAFIFSMFGVVVADNIILFLFFWELMSLTSWQLILTDEKQKGLNQIARFYFFMTHFGFVFILLLFLILSNGDLEHSTFSLLKENAINFKYPFLLFGFVIFGFLSKAGVVPLHVWLPYAHPKAPSPVSALMSGIMLKVALYAMIRFMFDVLYPWSLEWGIIILMLGAISSLVGVLYALSEHDIKALLANHSIENIGIILIGFGMGMIFDTLGLKTLSSFAFIASLFHIFNHMSFKSLLFMGAGSILHQTHTKNMEKYGGLIKSMPITAWTFLIASISISALPPSNGFLSEWMIFQSLLNSSSVTILELKLAIPFAVFALALTGGLAIACFVKAYGITFLGLHRSTNAEHATEVNILMQIGMVLMALVVISLMLFTPWFIGYFDQAISDFNHTPVYDIIFSHGIWQMNSVSSNGGVVSPIILLGLLIFITGAIYGVQRLFKPKIRLHHSWACGYKTSSTTQYSATGFAGPIRRFFSWLYGHDEKLKTVRVSDKETTYDESFFEVHVQPLFEATLYKKLVYFINLMSYYVYRFSHFEQQQHYSGVIFALLLFVLFSYRIFMGEFSWLSLIFELIMMTAVSKILIFGDKK